MPPENRDKSKLSMASLALGIVLALTVPAGPTLGAHPFLLLVSRGVTMDVRAVSSSGAPSQTPSTAPSVAYTLDLCTNHLYSGNAFPTDCIVSSPYGVAYDSGKGEVFVTNLGSNNVSVISDVTNKVVATIPIGGSLASVAYDSGKGEVFVTNPNFVSNSGNVSVISDVTNKVVATIPVGAEPFGVAYDSGKGEVFVANGGSDNVSVISDASNTVVGTIPVGVEPFGVAYDNGNGYVYVGNNDQGTISIISAGPATGVLGFPGYDGYILLVVIATILLALAITVHLRRKKAPPVSTSSPQTNLPADMPQPPPGHSWLIYRDRNSPKR